MKKKKSIIVEYRYRNEGDKDNIWTSLYPKGWSKWHPYRNIKTAQEVIDRQAKKFDFLEFRIRPNQKGEE